MGHGDRRQTALHRKMQGRRTNDGSRPLAVFVHDATTSVERHVAAVVALPADRNFGSTAVNRSWTKR